jgi:hypothetical protein
MSMYLLLWLRRTNALLLLLLLLLHLLYEERLDHVLLLTHLIEVEALMKCLDGLLHGIDGVLLTEEATVVVVEGCLAQLGLHLQ